MLQLLERRHMGRLWVLSVLGGKMSWRTSQWEHDYTLAREVKTLRDLIAFYGLRAVLCALLILLMSCKCLGKADYCTQCNEPHSSTLPTENTHKRRTKCWKHIFIPVIFYPLSCITRHFEQEHVTPLLSKWLWQGKLISVKAGTCQAFICVHQQLFQHRVCSAFTWLHVRAAALWPK